MTHNHSHAHSHDGAGAQGRLALVLCLTAGFMLVEAVGGYVTGSLALLADAGHMLSDVLSLALALFAAWVARRPPTPSTTFGYRRAEVLAALVNGVTLVAISLWIFAEAFQRFRDPPVVLGGGMLLVAVVGLLVNLVGMTLLWQGGQHDLNVSAALRHVLADLLGSVGAIAAALIILATGWLPADPLMSVVIGVLVLGSSWGVLRDSVRILLEATPAGVSAEEIYARMSQHAGIADIRDLHIWTITSGFPALTAHVFVQAGEDAIARRCELAAMLAGEFGIKHTTLQVDPISAASANANGLPGFSCGFVEPVQGPPACDDASAPR